MLVNDAVNQWDRFGLFRVTSKGEADCTVTIHLNINLYPSTGTWDKMNKDEFVKRAQEAIDQNWEDGKFKCGKKCKTYFDIQVSASNGKAKKQTRT